MSLFRRKTVIESLCQQSGCQFCFRDGQLYVVRSGGRDLYYIPITVHYIDSHRWTKFNAELPVRFPLGRTPDGLFAKAMMRNFNLGYSHWLMDIRESCDAILYLSAQTPTEWLNAGIFGAICCELATEVRAFHSELRDKFRYGVGSGMGEYGATGQQPRSGPPARKPWDNDLPEVRYFS
jgi:hypothetical protein